MKISLPVSVFLILTLLTTSIHATETDLKSAANLASERIGKRMSKISELKIENNILERSDGYLKYTGTDKTIEKLVEDENYDRLLIYTSIAKRDGVDTEFVAHIFAEQFKKNDLRKCVRDFPNDLQLCVPKSIEDEVKQNCKKKWPSDYRMQKYCVERQISAWVDLNK